MNKEEIKKINEAIKLAIKLYPHKHGDELYSEIVYYIERLIYPKMKGDE